MSGGFASLPANPGERGVPLPVYGPPPALRPRVSTFRQRPSRRRQRSPTASWLVLGTPATEILHHGRTTHLLLVKSGDHRRRFAVGQRLAVKEYVPGPSACHVHLTSVEGPASWKPFTLGQVDYAICRELGAHRVDDWRIAWVRSNEPLWYERTDEKCAAESVEPDQLLGANELLDQRCLARFERRWAGKLAWLLRFEVDIAAPPHLLAARSDELYVESDAMALHGEKPALRVEEWETHVGPKSRYRAEDRIAAQRAQRRAKEWPERLSEAQRQAKVKGYDIRDECRRFDRLIQQGRHEKALEQLERIEARVFPAAA